MAKIVPFKYSLGTLQWYNIGRIEKYFERVINSK